MSGYFLPIATPTVPKKVKKAKIDIHPDKEIQAIRDKCRGDYREFVKHFFNHLFWGEPSAMHRDMCEWESHPDRKGSNEVMAAPRGHAKTTLRVLVKAIHAICYSYEKFILVMAYSKGEATDKVKDILDELRTNEELQRVFGKLVPKYAGKTGFICTNRIKTRVLARSKGGQVRGLRHRDTRPTLVLVDDIEDLAHAKSAEQRKKTREWFMKDVMGGLQTDKTSNVIFVGTVLHSEGLLAELLTTPGWRRKKYSAIISWATNSALWEQWESIYRNLDNPKALDDAKAFYEANKAAMDEGVEVLWPEGDSYYSLMEYKIKYGLASLYSEKQNDPYDPEAQILHPENAKRFKVIWPHDPDWPGELDDYREGFVVQWSDDPDRQIHSDEMTIIGFWDPALAESLGSDYAAISICAQDENKYIYALETWMEKSGYERQIQKAFELWDRWGVETMHLEAVLFQKLLLPLVKNYQEVLEEKGEPYQMNIRPVKVHTDKTARIARLEPYFNNQWLLLNEKTPKILIEQLTVFPTAENDDGPDALEGAVSRLRRPRGNVQVVQGGNVNQ